MKKPTKRKRPAKVADFRLTEATPVSGTDTVKFFLEQIVYRKMEPTVAGQVLGITFRPQGVVIYIVKFTDTAAEDNFFDAELQAEKSVL